MRKLLIAALLAGQILSVVPPAVAAELTDSPTQQVGAFAGFRLRMPLDGGARQRLVRAGLTLAPEVQSHAVDGEVRTRIGEGLELGLAGREPVRLSLGGTPISRLARGPAGPDGDRLGISTVGWVAIGLGAVAVTLFALYAACGYGEICDVEDD